MRLKNKKTGDIWEFDEEFSIRASQETVDRAGARGGSLICYASSLAELNEDWEDVEEPKHWFIATDGRVLECNEAACWSGEKELGNYFETKEEAERAVKKIKAWQRLEDKGFRFNRWTIPEKPKTGHIKLTIEAEMDAPDSPYDLNLLFGGEE